jgi:hypothetical protein
MKDRPHHAYIRVRLPKFVITYMREIVKHENDLGRERWTVSGLLESWLLEIVAGDHKTANKLAERSVQFKQETEEWLRWIVNQNQ